MLTSKERAELRSKANDFETILIVGKGGITENVIAEADRALESRELIKCRVLESALMTAREASDALCEATGADGVSCVGSRFVLYRKSKSKEKKSGTAAPKQKKVSPVHKGIRNRRIKRMQERNQKNAYFKQAAIQKSIEKSRAAAARKRDTEE